MDKLDKSLLVCREEAQAVHSTLEPNVGSIITIIMIISIIISVIRLLQNCKKPPSELRGQFGSWTSELRLRKIVAKELGLKLYTEHGEAVVKAVKAHAANVNDAKMTDLINGVS